MSAALIDQPADIRPGEELDLAALHAWLIEHLDPKLPALSVRQFPRGFSNLTYLVTAGDVSWVLRRPPFGTKAKSAHDMGREYRVLRALDGVYPYSPGPLVYCDDEAVLGSPFYLMQYVPGCIIRQSYPDGMQLSPDEVRRQYFNWLDGLCDLHAIDYAAIGLADLGRPQGYVRRQVEGWSKRYLAARTEGSPDFEHTMQWLSDHLPDESARACIIHNDYKLDNVIWSAEDPLQLIGVLDWEMTTLGDPLMDLGCSLGYWVESSDPEFHRAFRNMPTDVPGAPARAELVRHFSERSGVRIDGFDFYFCFGLFRLAVIGQQIYYRYFHGQTRDDRFAAMSGKIRSLDSMCSLVIVRNS